MKVEMVVGVEGGEALFVTPTLVRARHQAHGT